MKLPLPTSCSALIFALLSAAPASDWPQWMGTSRDGIWRESALPEQFPEGGPAVRWRVPCGTGYSGPAVSGGQVFILDRTEEAGAKSENGGSIPGSERLLCLDAAGGQIVWKHTWDAPRSVDYGCGPRATPTVHEGLVYALGAEGDFLCLAASDGKVQWHRRFPAEYKCKPPMWGFAAHPLIRGDTVITLAGGEGSAVVALDRKTGKERWRSLTARDVGYCPPALASHHGKETLIIWHGQSINGLDPDTGTPLWSIPWEIRFGVSIAAPVVNGDKVLISGFWRGSTMLKLKADRSLPDILWQTEKESDTRTTHLNALMCTPVAMDGHFYGVCSYGQLRCLEWTSGDRKWADLDLVTGGKEIRWATAFLTRVAETNRFYIFTERGELASTRLTPDGLTVLSRAPIIDPDCPDVRERKVVWTHPAYAGGACFARNNREVVCVDLSARKSAPPPPEKTVQE